MSTPRLVRSKPAGQSPRSAGPGDEGVREVTPGTPRSRAVASARPATESLEAIRVRAYFLSLEREREGADPVQNWLDAEREITSRPALRRTAARPDKA